MTGRWKGHRGRERRHHRQIEQNGGRGGGREAGERVENAAVERDQRHEQELQRKLALSRPILITTPCPAQPGPEGDS